MACHEKRLLAELTAVLPPIVRSDGARLMAYTFERETDGTLVLTVPDDAVDAVTAVLDAHDPTPSIALPTEVERLAAVEAALLELMLREV